MSIPENGINLVSLYSGSTIPEYRDRCIFKLLIISILSILFHKVFLYTITSFIFLNIYTTLINRFISSERAIIKEVVYGEASYF